MPGKHTATIWDSWQAWLQLCWERVDLSRTWDPLGYMPTAKTTPLMWTDLQSTKMYSLFWTWVAHTGTGMGYCWSAGVFSLADRMCACMTVCKCNKCQHEEMGLLINSWKLRSRHGLNYILLSSRTSLPFSASPCADWNPLPDSQRRLRL